MQDFADVETAIFHQSRSPFVRPSACKVKLLTLSHWPCLLLLLFLYSNPFVHISVGGLIAVKLSQKSGHRPPQAANQFLFTVFGFCNGGLTNSSFMHERVKIFTRDAPLSCTETATSRVFGWYGAVCWFMCCFGEEHEVSLQWLRGL